MSLINQVLRDLDQRQGSAGPAAVKAAPRPALPPARQRLARWGLGLLATATAVVAGGWAQGSIAWPPRATTAATTVVAPAPATVPAVMPVAAPAPASAAAAFAATPASAVARAPALATPPTPAPASASGGAAAPESTPRALPATQTAVVATRMPASLESATAPHPIPKAEARIDLRAAARTPQERAEAHYQRGVTAHQAGQIGESATAFMAALREDPGFAAARQAQAGLLASQARTEEAMTLLQDGLAVTPQHPGLSLMLARLQADHHQVDAALATLQAASTQAAQSAEYQGVHAAVLQRAGRHTDAVEKFSQALRLAPAHSVWWMGLGLSLAAGGQADAAREAFLRAKSTGGLPPEASLYVDARLKQLL